MGDWSAREPWVLARKRFQKEERVRQQRRRHPSAEARASRLLLPTGRPLRFEPLPEPGTVREHGRFLRLPLFAGFHGGKLRSEHRRLRPRALSQWGQLSRCNRGVLVHLRSRLRRYDLRNQPRRLWREPVPKRRNVRRRDQFPSLSLRSRVRGRCV
jgi:hypothetical protein